jgi:dipeptidase E
MKQIIALGGLKREAQANNLIFQYILKATGKKKPRICLFPTAGDGTPEDSFFPYLNSAFSRFDCEISQLSLLAPKTDELEELVLRQDAIFVPGGDTGKMISRWRETGLDSVLKAAYESEVVLAGVSAGGHCWFEEGLTETNPGQFDPLKGIGFLQGSCCVHYDRKPERRTAYLKLIGEKKLKPGVAIDDSTALHYTNDKLSKSVSFEPGSKAYAVGNEKGTILETELITHYLGED